MRKVSVLSLGLLISLAAPIGAEANPSLRKLFAGACRDYIVDTVFDGTDSHSDGEKLKRIAQRSITRQCWNNPNYEGFLIRNGDLNACWSKKELIISKDNFSTSTEVGNANVSKRGSWVAVKKSVLEVAVKQLIQRTKLEEIANEYKAFLEQTEKNALRLRVDDQTSEEFILIENSDQGVAELNSVECNNDQDLEFTLIEDLTQSSNDQDSEEFTLIERNDQDLAESSLTSNGQDEWTLLEDTIEEC